MKDDEIKRILDYISDRIIEKEKWNKVRDYIINLQQENEVLENEKDMFYKVSQERLNKWLSLNDENNKLVEIIKDYKSRCEKAVEFIKTCNPNSRLDNMFLDECYLSNYGAEELINILNGRSDE